MIFVRLLNEAGAYRKPEKLVVTLISNGVNSDIEGEINLLD